MNNLSSADIAAALQLLESGFAPLPASTEDVIARALRELLALREAVKEPVAEVVAWDHPTEERKCDVRLMKFDIKPGLLYAAPQLPAVPDEIAGKSFEYVANKFQVSISDAQWVLVGWNACRAAIAAAPKPESAVKK